MAVMTIPMMQAQLTATNKGASKAGKPGRDMQFTPKSLDQYQSKAGNAMNLIVTDTETTWDFESDADFEGWQIYDADGDGHNWGVDENGNGIDGSICLTSQSYSGGALDPDNWLISPLVALGGTLTIYAANYMAWYPDQFQVYVCVGTDMGTTIENFVPISDMIAPPEDWTPYTFDLTEFAGQEGYFAIRHYDSYDMFRILIDNITLAAPAPAMPTNVTADPGITTADVAWESAEGVAWNLRYRPFIPGAADNLFWGFEEDTNDNTNIELTEGWTSIDADGDGNEWYHLYGSNFANHTGNGHVTSASYQGGVLTPDNWLVSPKVALDGTLSFWACGQDPSYAEEVFAVYVSTEDPTDPASFELISDEFITATGTMTEYTFDLSRYGGEEGYVAIRHYNVSDMFRLNIDDIAINYIEPAEWIVVEGLDNMAFTIEGLTPETTYEVQVQAVGENGMKSEWTESTIFTTLADQPAPEKTEKPVITSEETDEGVVVTATGEGHICLYWDDQLMAEGEGTATWTIPYGDEEEGEEYGVSATAQGENKLVSDYALETIYVPGKPVVPTEQTEAPSISADTQQGVHAYFVTITPSEQSDLYYRFCKDNGEWSDWILYDDVVPFEEDGYYQVEAYAIATGKTESLHVSCSFTVTPRTGLDELSGDKAVARVRFFNAMGQEMAQPNGMTIVVTTYTDGTSSAVKVMK